MVVAGNASKLGITGPGILLAICLSSLLVRCSAAPRENLCASVKPAGNSRKLNGTSPCIEKLTGSGSEDIAKGYYRHENVANGTNGTSGGTGNSNGTVDKNSTAIASSPKEETERPAALFSCNGPRICIPICCPLRNKWIDSSCVETDEVLILPETYHSETHVASGWRVNPKRFDLVVHDPCPDGDKYGLNPDEYNYDSYKLLENGLVFQSYDEKTIHPANYCLAVVADNKYDVLLCFDNSSDVLFEDEEVAIVIPFGMIISVPFLLATFLVYTLITELRNIYGETLRCYVGSLLIAYTTLACVQIVSQEQISDALCIVIAFTIHFSFLSSFFWLNVMCFDIWWTFGGFRSLQGSVKQRERKKFTIYSIYAWGSASILTVACAVMDFVPSVPKHFIKPQFGVESCWFATDAARAIYFYGPMGITVFCNICLFVLTAWKILQHKKDTAHHLKGRDSKRHDDNKQWFNLYLKLFVVMGINWSMEIVSWLFKTAPTYVWYITDLTNTLQGLIIFLIFVWKDKIRRLLLKKFGCKGRDVLSRNSTRSAYHSTGSRTCTTSAAPLQEKLDLDTAPDASTTTDRPIKIVQNTYQNKLSLNTSCPCS